MERSIFIRNKISGKALEWGFFSRKKLCFFWEIVDIIYKMLYNIYSDGGALTTNLAVHKRGKKGSDPHDLTSETVWTTARDVVVSD